MGGHHFTLVTVDGESLGAVELGRPDWPDGSIIYRGDEPNLRVVGRIEDEDECYTQATKRRDRLSGPHRKAYDRALDWAAMGSSEPLVVPVAEEATV